MPNPVAPHVIGLDIAKSVFQAHGADASGRAVLRRRLRRAEVLGFFARLSPCVVGIEACPSGHYGARELIALGHEVRLIPPQFVRPFVKTNKNDAADAEAISEAVLRPSMRFVPVKSAEQQAAMMIHRTRALLLRQRTQLINALRGHLAEFGLVASRGTRNIRQLADLVEETDSATLPDAARAMLVIILEQIREVAVRVAGIDRTLDSWAKSSEECRRLMAIPGVGTISATALVLAMGDPARFRSGRHFAAWLGLVLRQNSSGEKERLGRISKRGDGYIRTLLIHGARSITRWHRESWSWLAGMMARRPTNVVAVAIANKTARTAWALLARGRAFEARGSRSAAAA
ncbi:IS110 family RNA-guided transposase [Muricoccus vinaceus]|uniref:IS110 family transposase n=1 Tax=Muricoccus vinaceus TaxID=424704 RepID=A0ABV6IWZ8_9PROT